ncbi:DUF4013 domain-containing protein [Halopelagius longus]|uniref:DUF4013 domain-containing protein n=1 Tax=Halopelagius longus TaxID=1236180 RepID=A0A1H0ZBG7_9EURY|nr:DUF4013 domain-containing protein [Halopelagius longus]RDI72924.1 DUF4013 domain-containing protein [Halopelagius longus]SDQ24754.1 Protein of unknown function [Halopelagius longus]
MLRHALSYPLNSDDRIPTILIGGVLTVLSFVIPILPQAILQGYGVRVLRSSAKDESAAPSFIDWVTLIVDGIKLLLINLAYTFVFLVPIVVALFAFGLGEQLLSGGPTPSAVGSAVDSALAAAFVLFIVVLSVAVAYIVPAAYANFAIEGSMGSAFDFSTIKEATTTSEYFTAWVLAAVIGLLLGALGIVLSVVLVGVLVLFYVQVVAFYLVGRGFSKGLAKKRRAVAETTF